MGSFSVLHWAIFIAIGCGIYSLAKSMFGGRGRADQSGAMICPSCGTRGIPRTKTRCSTLIELILWLCFLVPGLIYSIWRLTTRYDACPSCGQPGMIGVGTPKGRMLAQQYKNGTEQ